MGNIKKNTVEDNNEFARHHGHLAACSMFRPLGKINQHDRKRRIIHHAGGEGTPNPYKLKIVCTWELDTDDESVLLVLISMISTHKRIHQIVPGHSCREKLKEEGTLAEDTTAATITNKHEILQKLGWDTSGKSYKRLEDSLERLNHAMINYTPATGWSTQSNLISTSLYQKNGKEIEDRLLITINALSAAVIFGTCKNGFSHHEIHERRILNHSQIALGVYSMLVNRTQPGKSSNTYLSTILQRVYGLADNDHATPKQRALVSKCIKEWSLPGWRVSISGRGEKTMVSAHRPKALLVIPPPEE